MCGISGIFDFNTTKKDYLKSDLINFNNTLGHRGPDNNGIWIDPSHSIGLAHTRLSILDLSKNGSQPMINQNNQDVICYNGEIFNYSHLNRRYLSGVFFKSNSDTETILKLYQKYYLNILNIMDGMFAFAIWDHNRQELLIARDKSGKKPLYYTEFNGQFIFASELKVLLNHNGINKKIDNKKIYDFFSYHYVPSSETIFKNIYKLEPGSFIRVGRQGLIEQKKYYQLRKKQINYTNENEISEKVYFHINNSIKNRMISDTPVGAFLSGGVDSSAIVALMRQYSKNEIKTFFN